MVARISAKQAFYYCFPIQHLAQGQHLMFSTYKALHRNNYAIALSSLFCYYYLVSVVLWKVQFFEPGRKVMTTLLRKTNYGVFKLRQSICTFYKQVQN